MRKTQFILLYLLFAAAPFVYGNDSAAQKGPVQALFFRAFENAPVMVIPKLFDETPIQALQNYVVSLKNQTDLQPFVSDLLSASEIEVVHPRLDRPALFLANRIDDQSREATRVNRFMKQINIPEKYLLAIAASERLSLSDRQKFNDLIVDMFSLLVVMGGDDVAPELYSEQVTYARKFNKVRDFHEIELIRNFYLKEKGFIFGVCRGLQITSVALGYKLHQDIENEIGTSVKHASNEHPVKLLETKNNILKNMGLSETFEVHSLHHQSVKFHSGGPLQVAAISDDGVVEALEFKNGKGLLVQFHPELKSSPETSLIMNALAQKSQALHSCEYAFN